MKEKTLQKTITIGVVNFSKVVHLKATRIVYIDEVTNLEPAQRS